MLEESASFVMAHSRSGVVASFARVQQVLATDVSTGLEN